MAKNFFEFEIFKTTRIQFSELFADAKDYLEKTYGSLGQYFTVASPMGQLLRVTLDMGKLILFYIEDSITERNILTASRPQSIRGLARLAGHNSTRAIGASGDIKLTFLGKPVTATGNSIIVPNHARILNTTNSLKYVLMLNSDELRIDMSERNAITVKISQGDLEIQQFTSTGESLQSYEINEKQGRQIDHFFVKVYVNGEEYKIYDSLYDMPRLAKGVLVKTGIDSGIDIFFGNDNFGLIPARNAEIRVEYLVTQGDAGNIRSDQNISWKFLDPGYDITGTEIDLNECLKIDIANAINFGTNAEPLFLTRLIAPKTSRSFVLANPESYIIFLEKFNTFSQIDAFSTFDDDYIDDDNVIYLFLIPDIRKRLATNENYYTVPINNFTLTENEKSKIYSLIEESGQKMVTAVNAIVNPILSKYVLNISLTAFEGFSRDYIRQQIIDRTSNYFLDNRRRDFIPKSDIITIIENIDGVDSVNVWFVSEKNELAKTDNPNAETVGVDNFGDIVIGRGELSLIRGGWSDRNGVFYEDSTDDRKPSSINIEIRSFIPVSYNAERQRINVSNLRG